MAKIYETRLDIEREGAEQQRKDAACAMQSSFDNAVIGALVATGSHTSEQLHQLSSAVAKQPPSSFFSGFNKVLMWAGVVTGIYSAIKWLRGGAAIVQAEAHKKILGPEEIVYPPASQDHTPSIAATCNHCSRLQQEVATSPLRQL